MTNAEPRDRLTYTANEVYEALVLGIEGTPDEDPDRRADLVQSFRGLTFHQKRALTFYVAGFEYGEICQAVLNLTNNKTKVGERFVKEALADLKRGMNGC